MVVIGGAVTQCANLASFDMYGFFFVGGGHHMIVPRYVAHLTPGGAHAKSTLKTLQMLEAMLPTNLTTIGCCAPINAREHVSDDGSNAPNGRTTTATGANDVASEIQGMTVGNGWHTVIVA